VGNGRGSIVAKVMVPLGGDVGICKLEKRKRSPVCPRSMFWGMEETGNGKGRHPMRAHALAIVKMGHPPGAEEAQIMKAKSAHLLEGCAQREKDTKDGKTNFRAI